MATPLGLPQSNVPHIFTLGVALRRLGHCCFECCWRADGELRLPIRFIRQSGTSSPLTLLAVDLTCSDLTLSRLRQRLWEVDRCTRPHRIRVCADTDLHRALQGMTRVLEPAGQVSYQTFDSSSVPGGFPDPACLRVADPGGGTSARGVTCPRCPARQR